MRDKIEQIFDADINSIIYPLIVLLAALLLYGFSFSRELTWIYTSGDAGDWLSLTNWWYVPHSWGKPLVVLWIKFLTLFPGNDIIKLTIGMSVVPGALTIMMTYLTAKRFVPTVQALIGAFIIMISLPFLSQSTVLEQYAITALFITCAFYFHTRENRPLTLLFLGLTTGTHIIGLPITFLWVMTYFSEWRTWLKYSYIYIIAGVLPYGLILYLMAFGTDPKLLAGSLSWASINSYLGNTTSAVDLALIEAPNRIGQAIQVIALSLGLGLVPFIRGLLPWSKLSKLAMILIGFVFWFYLTNRFPSVWKWTAMVLPIAGVYVSIGLSKLPKWHSIVVYVSVLVCIVVTGQIFHTGNLASENPIATKYTQALWDLPDGTVIVTPRGGAYGFGLFYVLSEGKDLIPVSESNPFPSGTIVGNIHNQGYEDYLTWFHENYPIEGNNVFEMTQYALDNGFEVYYAQPPSAIWSRVFEFAPGKTDYLLKIKSVNHHPDLSEWITHE